MSDSQTIVALEIGTSKMQVFVGEIIDNKDLNVVGMGQASSIGIKKGEVLDIRKSASQAQAAIMQAEKKLSSKLNNVYVALTGSHIKGFRNVGSANVSGADNIVRLDDIERAKDDAKSKSIPDAKAYIHKICCGYYLDGVFTTEPLGKTAHHIAAEYWLAYGDADKIENVIHIVESFGMDLKQIILSGLASARIVTTPEQRMKGVLVLDIGCGTTDYAFFKNGKPLQTGSIPIGGDHVTNDLSFGLQISIKNANKLKLNFGKLILPDSEKGMKIWTEGDKGIGDRSFLLDSINKVIDLRFRELFEIIKEELEDFFDDGSISQIVITGGVSKTPEISVFASEVFGVPTSIGKFSQWVKTNLCHPEYATALGLLDCALNDSAKAARRASNISIVDKFKNIFGKK